MRRAEVVPIPLMEARVGRATQSYNPQGGLARCRWTSRRGILDGRFPGTGMSAPPLSHHEILGLVEPFARHGLRVDLVASERIARRLMFRPVEHPTDEPALDGLHETLQLESFGTGTCRLTRTLAIGSGLRATVQALGPDPGVLLRQVRAVDPGRLFRRGRGYVIAASFELYPTADGRAGALAVLVRGMARLDGGATLTMTLSPVRGVAADLTLEAAPGSAPRLPEDLFAVLGWDWARLIATREGWKTKLRLRGDNARRTARADQALARAAGHLVETLGEPPARFHERWHVARWGVFFRRALPVLMVLSVIGVALLLPRVPITERPGLVTLIFHVPIALIALSFSLQELSQFEIPPLPRRSTAQHWR